MFLYYSVKTLDEVVAIVEEPSQDTATVLAAATSSPDEPPTPKERHDCSYCNQTFSALWKLQQHIQTPGHWSKVNSDTDKKDQWKYRDPPWDVVNGLYRECQE